MGDQPVGGYTLCTPITPCSTTQANHYSSTSTLESLQPHGPLRWQLCRANGIPVPDLSSRRFNNPRRRLLCRASGKHHRLTSLRELCSSTLSGISFRYSLIVLTQYIKGFSTSFGPREGSSACEWNNSAWPLFTKVLLPLEKAAMPCERNNIDWPLFVTVAYTWHACMQAATSVSSPT